MAEIIEQEKGKKGGKRRPKKLSTRIDMTPMVDLMCLLITFFMLTTAFSKPKVMVITMPEKSKVDQPQVKIAAWRTLTILLTGDDAVYYYAGEANPRKPPLPDLIKSDFSKNGIRKVLLEKNKDLFRQIAEYREKRISGKLIVADTTADAAVKKMKKEDMKGPIILIKADEKAKYKNVVSIIDEMSICNIASYAVVDIFPIELEMLKNAPK